MPVKSIKTPKVKPYSSSYWSNTMKVLYGSWQEEFWRKHFSCGSLKYQGLDKRGWLAAGRHHQLVFDGKMPLWAWCAQLPADIWSRNLDSNLSSDTECPLGEPLSSLRSSSHFGGAIGLTSSVGHSWPLHNKFFCGAHRCLCTEPEQRPQSLSTATYGNSNNSDFRPAPCSS